MKRTTGIWIAAIAVAVLASVWTITASEPEQRVQADARTVELAEPGVPGPFALGEPDAAECPADLGATADELPLEPTAICRLIPQCSKDVDCDAQCGAGNGNCVHSRCPIRVCRCR